MPVQGDLTLFDYELLDCGGGRRLERFADIVVDRPAPQATWPKSQSVAEWLSADAYYERPVSGQGHWLDTDVFPQPWQLQLDNIRLELRPAANGQVGIFPEQLPNWRWMAEHLQRQQGRLVRVLNTFAYTGVATLMASAASTDVEVCHVDGARASVMAARRNAELSGLQQRPIRWIVDDVMTFLHREIKRGNRYDGIILDPPAFGRGAHASWQLKRDLPELLGCVKQLMSDTPSFIVLSCHAPDLTSSGLAVMLDAILGASKSKSEAIDLVIPSISGNELPSSICARVKFP